MKANDFEKASGLMKELRDIEADLVVCVKSLNVTIASRYQDDGLVDAVRPYVIAELQRRGRVLQDKLKKLGVTFERSGAFG